ncbi:DUF7284 family protein [Natrialba taiwanensis]|uniref:Uncharacterized protein n=1 Tax=Natrialba taiwanensis DSM 12281 TaxID=1230458 RepID=M0ADI0_9EURY|nr:hypothetical protein [Natrialba taiwanensis]ELY96451.1 hypothetical protein C484_02025 [Natrialba taiwanensis DSM 12281]
MSRTRDPPAELAGGRSRDRAISTVMDVALALLIISACVVMIGVYLHSDDDSVDGTRADRASQTLSGSTITITYDMTAENESGHAPVDSDNFEVPDGLDPDESPELYRVTTYNSASALVAESALVGVEYDGQQPLAYADDVESSVDAAIRGQLVGSDDSIYVVATWEPYANSSISGTATAGDRPPRTADVSSTSVTVSTRMAGADQDDYEALASSFYDARAAGSAGVDGTADTLAELIVEAMFPVAETQYALESTRTENAVTVYDYRQLALAFGGDDLKAAVDEEITGVNPDASAANEQLAAGVADPIAEDMRDDPIRDELDRLFAAHPDEDEFTTAAVPYLEEYVSIETVDLTVHVTDQ